MTQLLSQSTFKKLNIHTYNELHEKIKEVVKVGVNCQLDRPGVT